MVLPGGLTVYYKILVALENSRTDEAILAHIETLARLMDEIGMKR